VTELGFLQPLDNVLAVCVALIAAAMVVGGAVILRPHHQDETAAVNRNSWAIARLALVVCLVAIGVFVVMLELIAASASS
jgi:hypothetical protein